MKKKGNKNIGKMSWIEEMRGVVGGENIGGRVRTLAKQKGVEENVMYMIVKAIGAVRMWKDEIKGGLEEKNGYIDSVVRETVMNRPGWGVGYMSVMIARGVRMSERMREEIEVTRVMNPEVRIEMKGEMRRICGGEGRMRLALIIANEIGKMVPWMNMENVEYGMIQIFMRGEGMLSECCMNYLGN